MEKVLQICHQWVKMGLYVRLVEVHTLIIAEVYTRGAVTEEHRTTLQEFNLHRKPVDEI